MSRYEAAHAQPAGPGDARPTALQIIKDKGVEGQLTGKIIVITGVSSGLGIETARTLSATGATLYLIARDLSKPALLKGATPNFHSRVVSVASSIHQVQSINASDNYDYSQGGYDPVLAYGQSKTANVYLANEIERRYGGQNLHATSLHPGTIMTNLARHMSADAVEGAMSSEAVRSGLKSPQQGAATTVWAAIGKEWATKGGKYLVDCSVAVPDPEDKRNPYGPTYTAHTYDPESEARLWRDSLKLVGLEEAE